MDNVLSVILVRALFQTLSRISPQARAAPIRVETDRLESACRLDSMSNKLE